MRHYGNIFAVSYVFYIFDDVIILIAEFGDNASVSFLPAVFIEI